jgi:L-lactate dehydrogenase complex protein LldG
MSSRENILALVKQNQPTATGLPSLGTFGGDLSAEQFIKVFTSIGGKAIEINSLDEIPSKLPDTTGNRIVTTIDQLSFAEQIKIDTDPHELSDVYLAIIPGVFAVAENGAIWITEEQIKVRALPFICEHLAIVVSKKNIVATLHEGYDLIQKMEYSFGTYIAGPSKTADIEQSLVLGAHGSRTMTAFVLT